MILNKYTKLYTYICCHQKLYLLDFSKNFYE
jgi:hypothetical protein